MAEQQQSKNAFVTGGTGFVGANLIEQLVGKGWNVVALHRADSDTSFLQGLQVKLVQGDITDIQSLETHMPQNVDAVFHVAASLNMWSRDNAIQTAINVDGTRNMVDTALAKNAGVFILTSTISAYGSQSEPIFEDTPSNAESSPINYEKSKWLAEQEVRKGIARGLNAIIINPCAVIGPKDTHGWAQFFFMVKEGKVKGIPPGIASFNHVSEVAKAHITAAEKGQPGANYILSGYEASFADMLGIIADLLNIEVKAKTVSPFLLQVIARINAVIAAITGKPPELSPEMATLMSQKVICGSDKAERELGYKPVPLRTCLEDCYNWLVETDNID